MVDHVARDADVHLIVGVLLERSLEAACDQERLGRAVLRGGPLLPNTSKLVSARMLEIVMLPATLGGIVTVCEERVLLNSTFGCPFGRFAVLNTAGSCGFAVQSQ